MEAGQIGVNGQRVLKPVNLGDRFERDIAQSHLHRMVEKHVQVQQWNITHATTIHVPVSNELHF